MKMKMKKHNQVREDVFFYFPPVYHPQKSGYQRWQFKLANPIQNLYPCLELNQFQTQISHLPFGPDPHGNLPNSTQPQNGNDNWFISTCHRMQIAADFHLPENSLYFNVDHIKNLEQFQYRLPQRFKKPLASVEYVLKQSMSLSFLASRCCLILNDTICQTQQTDERTDEKTNL